MCGNGLGRLIRRWNVNPVRLCFLLFHAFLPAKQAFSSCPFLHTTAVEITRQTIFPRITGKLRH